MALPLLRSMHPTPSAAGRVEPRSLSGSECATYHGNIVDKQSNTR
jgi:hypothetical protein